MADRISMGQELGVGRGALRPGKRLKGLLRNEARAAAEGRLGLSQGERDQGAAAAQEAAGRQAAASAGEVQRAAIAGGANQFTGAAADLQRDIATDAASTAAAARPEQDEISARLAAVRRQTLQGGLERQQQINRENAKAAIEVVAKGAFAAATGGGSAFAEQAGAVGSAMFGGG